jgi:hypothetical protein
MDAVKSDLEGQCDTELLVALAFEVRLDGVARLGCNDNESGSKL